MIRRYFRGEGEMIRDEIGDFVHYDDLVLFLEAAIELVSYNWDRIYKELVIDKQVDSDCYDYAFASIAELSRIFNNLFREE